MAFLLFESRLQARNNLVHFHSVRTFNQYRCVAEFLFRQMFGAVVGIVEATEVVRLFDVAEVAAYKENLLKAKFLHQS